METTIALRTYTSYSVLEELRRLMKETWNLKEIRMDYNTRCLPDEKDIESYPVTLIFEENGKEFAVKILSLSVGYRGSGPFDFSKILEFFKIPYDKDEIFTKSSMGEDGFIRLRFYKNNVS